MEHQSVEGQSASDDVLTNTEVVSDVFSSRTHIGKQQARCRVVKLFGTQYTNLLIDTGGGLVRGVLMISLSKVRGR